MIHLKLLNQVCLWMYVWQVSKMKHIIRVEHLRKEFGKLVAVDDVNLQVEEGKIYGILGPNGAGKSTTIRMLCGVITPTSR